MRGRWSLGVVMAIAVAICVATSGAYQSAPQRQAGPPVQVTLELNSSGTALHVSFATFAISLKF